MTDRISPALTPEEWAGVQTGTVGIVGTPNAQANHQLAALCLYGQPFGFTREDVVMLRCVEVVCRRESLVEPASSMASLADRIAALLPPETP